MEETKVKWHPYPQERPIEDDDYLITVKYSRRGRKVMKWDCFNGYFNIYGDVIAWAELPEPYKEE